ncbi:hypothetical protein LTS06_012349, partial [Exophiala xenobiotica]
MQFNKKEKRPRKEEVASPAQYRSGQSGPAADAPNSMDPKSKQTDITYPTGIKLGLLMMSVFVGMFLSSLDKFIVSTAIPQITNEFNSADDIG